MKRLGPAGLVDAPVKTEGSTGNAAACRESASISESRPPARAEVNAAGLQRESHRAWEVMLKTGGSVDSTTAHQSPPTTMNSYTVP